MKCKLTVHVALAPRVNPQVFDEMEKSPTFAPAIEIELMISVAAPLLRTVTVLVEELLRSSTVPKLIELGVSAIKGTPVELKLTPVTFAPLIVFD